MRSYVNVHGTEPVDCKLFLGESGSVCVEIGQLPNVVSVWLDVASADKLADLFGQAAQILREREETAQANTSSSTAQNSAGSTI